MHSGPGSHISRALFRALAVATVGLSAACSKCDRAGIDYAKAIEKARMLRAASENTATTATTGVAVYPDPFLATGTTSFTTDSLRIAGKLIGFSLIGLPDPARLENSVIKVFRRTTSDAPFTPTAANNTFYADVEAPAYSGVVVYHSLMSLYSYVHALGFSVCDNRLLHTFVRAGSASDPANAFYDNKPFSQTSPRTIHYYGRDRFHPAASMQTTLHEGMHDVIECITARRGIDDRTDRGAPPGEPSGIHEFGADGIAMALTERDSIFEWLNLSDPSLAAGTPARDGLDRKNRLLFTDTLSSDKITRFDFRYLVSETILRSWWTVRSAMASAGEEGAVRADALLLTAISMLPKNASITNLYDSLQKADKELFCGENSSDIRAAFQDRGFFGSGSQLQRPLDVVGRVATFVLRNGSYVGSPAQPGGYAAIGARLRNNSDQTARNVRLTLVPKDQRLTPFIYETYVGDMKPGATVETGGNLSWDYAPWARIETTARPGNSLPYVLQVNYENGPKTVQTVNGSVGL